MIVWNLKKNGSQLSINEPLPFPIYWCYLAKGWEMGLEVSVQGPGQCAGFG